MISERCLLEHSNLRGPIALTDENEQGRRQCKWRKRRCGHQPANASEAESLASSDRILNERVRENGRDHGGTRSAPQPMRPALQSAELGVQSAFGQAYAKPLIITEEHRTRAGSQPGPIRPRPLDRRLDEPGRRIRSGRGRHSDRRPRTLRALIHPDQRNQNASGSHIGDPPEVPLHRHPMGSLGLAEREISP